LRPPRRVKLALRFIPYALLSKRAFGYSCGTPPGESAQSGRRTAAERTTTMVSMPETTTLLEVINLCMAVAGGVYLLWWLYRDPGRK
jgi:hypothetical protein